MRPCHDHEGNDAASLILFISRACPARSVLPPATGGRVHRDGMKRQGPGHPLPAVPKRLHPETREANPFTNQSVGAYFAGQGLRGGPRCHRDLAEERGNTEGANSEPEEVSHRSASLWRATTNRRPQGRVRLRDRVPGPCGRPAPSSSRRHCGTAPSEIAPPPLGNARRRKGVAVRPGPWIGRAEVRQHHRRLLLRDVSNPAGGRVLRVRVSGESAEVGHHPDAEKV